MFNVLLPVLLSILGFFKESNLIITYAVNNGSVLSSVYTFLLYRSVVIQYNYYDKAVFVIQCKAESLHNLKLLTSSCCN